MRIAVRPLRDEDRPDWERLYEGYAAFYKVAHTPEMRQTVWSWIMNPSMEVDGWPPYEVGTQDRNISIRRAQCAARSPSQERPLVMVCIGPRHYLHY